MSRNADTATIIKAYTHSIVIHSFLGYLWWLYVDYTVGFVNSLSSMSVVGVIVLTTGTLIFFDVLNRVSPYNHLRMHPLNIVGKGSFVLAALLCSLLL